MAPRRLVEVTWLDAEGSLSWPLPAAYSLPIVRTVGWLLEDLEDRVTVGAESFEDGSYRDVTTVPRGMVKKVRKL